MTFAALPAYIPSPSDGVWHLGPLPIRGYAFCIIIGIVAAVALSDRRWLARGGAVGTMNEISIWAVPFGLVGGRVYHVLTDWSEYFGKGGSPGRSLEVWKGGLGIPGAVALGGLGVYIACRRLGLRMPVVADAMAPGLVLAQGLGRWGNWFNQELYGRPTHLPWAVRIDVSHQVGVIASKYQEQPYGFYQPTFLYESIWDVSTAVVLILLDRRYKLGHGRVFALYLVIYGLGRSWIEALRIDPAHHILGLRLNDWTSVLIVLGGVVGYLVSARRHPGRDLVLTRDPTDSGPARIGPAARADQEDAAPDAGSATVESPSSHEGSSP
jgi:prolipoprotein diacylglyceryl transferase